MGSIKISKKELDEYPAKCNLARWEGVAKKYEKGAGEPTWVREIDARSAYSFP